jgi:hypothetical protein
MGNASRVSLQTRSEARVAGSRSTFRDVTRTQWNAFFAAFLGWAFDGFDFSILSFLLIDIEHSFTVDKALAGALGTVTLVFRLVGGLGAGTAADRFGRKLPWILSSESNEKHRPSWSHSLFRRG